MTKTEIISAIKPTSIWSNGDFDYTVISYDSVEKYAVIKSLDNNEYSCMELKFFLNGTLRLLNHAKPKILLKRRPRGILGYHINKIIKHF